ncbi:phage baseplate protein [Enterobacter ludwigii]|uniref:phage baseplate protein n=1 Tax=Enterobacter ludwigii TaxID=299767 RepID=UPI003974A6D8
MAITGLFTRNQPRIGNLYFDALLKESTELRTDVSDFPLETAETAQDNAVTGALYITMEIGVSDNWYRGVIAQQEELAQPLIDIGGGLTAGMAASLMSGRMAALSGIAASVGLAVYQNSQGTTRSQNLLQQLRTIQRNHETFDLIASKGASYKNCLITNTRTEVDKETEGGLIIVVDMQQLTIIHDTVEETNANLPYGDTSATQGQREVSGGEVALTEIKSETFPVPEYPDIPSFNPA